MGRRPEFGCQEPLGRQVNRCKTSAGEEERVSKVERSLSGHALFSRSRPFMRLLEFIDLADASDAATLTTLPSRFFKFNLL